MSIWVFMYRFSAALVIAVGLTWLVSIFYPQFRQINDLSARQRQLEEEIRQDEEVLKHLRLKQQKLLDDPRLVEKIAREQLGMAKPGETIFKFGDDLSPLDSPTGIRSRARN